MIRILIVDDDTHWSEAVKDSFSKEDAVELLPVAHSGNHALNSIIKNRPDLIILDLILPEYDGLYIINYINSKISDYRPIIYVLTTINTEKNHKLIENLNVDYYSVKPINPAVVAENAMTLIKISGGTLTAIAQDGIKKFTSLSLDTYIDDYLHEFDIPLYRKSVDCLRLALYHSLEDDQLLKAIMGLYAKVGDSGGTKLFSPSAVERNIRSAILLIVKADSAYFHQLFPNYVKKLSNAEFLQKSVYVLRRRIGDALSD